MSRLRRLSTWDRLGWKVRQWRGFPLPVGDRVDCVKSRVHVGGMLADVDWGHMAAQSVGGNAGFVPPSGVGPGTPMQLGQVRTRPLSYGQWDITRTRIPLPVGGLYWTTGYPSPTYDERCIVAGADPREVVEMIQFKPDQGEMPAGFSQQARQFGRWYDGELIEGKATTASGLPVHPFVWGPGSSDHSHAQALVVSDYVGADGLLSEGVRAGDWLALDPSSLSYHRMVQASAECASRAIALVVYGCRVIDRTGYSDAPNDKVGTMPHPPSLHTQAGSWVNATNLSKFTIALTDLKRVVG